MLTDIPAKLIKDKYQINHISVELGIGQQGPEQQIPEQQWPGEPQ